MTGIRAYLSDAWEEHPWTVALLVAVVLAVAYWMLRSKRHRAHEQKETECRTLAPAKFQAVKLESLPDLDTLRLLDEVPAESSVLEIGSGADPGASACCLGSALKQGARHVLVETDPAKMKEAMAKRKQTHSKFQGCGDTLSRCPVMLGASSGLAPWWNMPRDGEPVRRPLTSLTDGPTTVTDLQQQKGWPFDALVAHCEGFELTLSRELGSIMQFNTVVILGTCIDKVAPTLIDGCSFRLAKRNGAGAVFKKP